MQLTISGYSTALYSTWYFIEELGILFDCGDGFVSTMLSKSRKANYVFVSHADRDHLTGIHQFAQLNSRDDFPKFFYPKNCGSFPALESFLNKFDNHTSKSDWIGITKNEKIWIKDSIYVQSFRNNHVLCDESLDKSFSYKVVESKFKLKDEFKELSPSEIKVALSNKSKEETHNNIERTILYYSGDCPCENFNEWKDSEILIHESTFIDSLHSRDIKKHGNQHSNLEEVIALVSKSSVKTLILGHFSSRYSDSEIDDSISLFAEKHNLNITIYRLLPGNSIKNILSTSPFISKK
jgi:ribonuclease Z